MVEQQIFRGICWIVIASVAWRIYHCGLVMCCRFNLDRAYVAATTMGNIYVECDIILNI